ncbi:zinc finger Ran-binding domain-containing protein 2-like isoform X2 [Neocloeon triangulifer]|uniref:zinc finger Ran-binding domain-containing protein 2-like isoform X2 n=1 Tax=Neocloeon triangulifer TaxID=2078957 RepID=UPI00286ED9DC|nr:zinc finger Ran-binding domain-containing protein 2-like isoform X2 [Neocloeon triangulifer]
MQKSSGRHESGGRGGPRKGDSDWLCPDTECANWNFAWRTSCNRCSGPKPPGEDAASSSNSKSKKLGHEIGKAMAEKSKGLFSADDWQCSKCGNVNWARRHQCNVCNAPRFGEVEERTGFGGGFNDRGVVEYKERKEESDDEWDEFGRRKKKSSGKSSSSDKNKRSHSSDEDKRSSNKKKRRDSTSSSSDSEVEKKKPKVESEDEDEDSGDEGDLSKYDLSGWGEDDDSKK